MQIDQYDFPRAETLSRRSKHSQRYERFGENIRYLTVDELQNFFDSIDNYYYKLMFQAIYELGCKVGEFVRIQVKHLNFSRSTVYFPAENTKTKHPRTSYLPNGLMNEIRRLLKQKGIATKRAGRIRKPKAYLFHPGPLFSVFRHSKKSSKLQNCQSQVENILTN